MIGQKRLFIKKLYNIFKNIFENNYDLLSKILPNNNVMKRISSGDEIVNHNNYWNNIKKQN